MKNAFPLLFLILPTLVWAQRVDSIAIRQVDSLIQISRTLTGQRDFDQAIEVNSAAEKIALEKLGRKSAAFGSCCFNHGRVLHIKGDIPEAEKWYLDSKTIREKALGKEHPDYAWSLSNLAFLYKDMGRYEKAESLLLEALTIREKALGKEHPEYVASLHILGRLYSDMGLYEKAEPLYLEAKAIREKVLGKVHPDYAASLVNLGILYYFMGLYEKAEPLYLEAKEIFENRLNDPNPPFSSFFPPPPGDSLQNWGPT
ncbi:MAG: tetratricopeptide repeat-containing protein [Saprospirales bacterium]|nr:tetratricopeptide repeat-containing protein [Saprospirales bacterium]